MNNLRRNGLKGQKALSPGHRPGYKDMGRLALKGQKLYLLHYASALSGRLGYESHLPRAMPWAECFLAFQAVSSENF